METQTTLEQAMEMSITGTDPERVLTVLASPFFERRAALFNAVTDIFMIGPIDDVKVAQVMSLMRTVYVYDSFLPEDAGSQQAAFFYRMLRHRQEREL